jgi:hypothetical protein
MPNHDLEPRSSHSSPRTLPAHVLLRAPRLYAFAAVLHHYPGEPSELFETEAPTALAEGCRSKIYPIASISLHAHRYNLRPYSGTYLHMAAE